MTESIAFMLRFEEPRVITPTAANHCVGAAAERRLDQVPPPGTMTVTETTAETTDDDLDRKSYYTIPLRGSP